MSICGESTTTTIDVDAYAKIICIDFVSATKVSKNEDVMTGQLNMSENKITGVADPLFIQDAATKSYVDALTNLKLNKTVDTMTDALSIGNNRIVNVSNPTNTQDAVTKYYLEQLRIPKFTVTSGNIPNTNII